MRESRRGALATEPARAGEGAAHALRSVKDEVEESLYLRGRDPFTETDLVFFDTTSHHFHGGRAAGTSRRDRSAPKSGPATRRT